VRFITGVEDFAFATGRDREDLSFIPGGDVESSVGRKGKVPDVFCFGIEKNRLFAGGRYAVSASATGLKGL